MFQFLCGTFYKHFKEIKHRCLSPHLHFPLLDVKSSFGISMFETTERVTFTPNHEPVATYLGNLVMAKHLKASRPVLPS